MLLRSPLSVVLKIQAEKFPDSKPSAAQRLRSHAFQRQSMAKITSLAWVKD
jgi:hypothetical protein